MAAYKHVYFTLWHIFIMHYTSSIQVGKINASRTLREVLSTSQMWRSTERVLSGISWEPFFLSAQCLFHDIPTTAERFI